MVDATQEQQPTAFLDQLADKPPIIEDGKLVLLEVDDSTIRYGRESGDPYINLRLRVVDDPDDEGLVMFDRLMLPNSRRSGETDKGYQKRTDNRCWRLKLASVAFQIPSGQKWTYQQLAEAFRARRAWCRVKIEQDDKGNDQSRPDAYYKERPIENQKS